MLPLARPVEEIHAASLATLGHRAGGSRACPLWRGATATVFGKRATSCRHHVDRRTARCSGGSSRRAVRWSRRPVARPRHGDAGLDRKALYLTNAVKHFKYEMRGEAKLHKRANASEQAACRQWLEVCVCGRG